MRYILLATTTAALLAQASPVANTSTLPIIDLGYIRQQASAFNEIGQYYNFSNIAFAQPPLGDLRFAAPQPPLKTSGVRDGNGIAPICPQAYPLWLAKLFAGQQIPLDPSNNEDCLYLDVFVPKAIFDKRQLEQAPVLIWIYGGGLVIGSKTDDDPRGLLARSTQNTSSDGMIYVAANYRLGNFGSLGGSDFTSQGGASNIDLLDQRMAIDWVAKNIHLFGGDASRITLMGESGGASSIAHQITGNDALSHGQDFPFKQVIMQSPAEAKPNSNDLANKQFHAFLQELNVSSLAEARKLDTSTLQKANYQLIQRFPTGVFPYTYNVDNKIVHASARKEILKESCISQEINAMISYNRNEGFIFTPQDNTTFNDYVKEWLPALREDQLATVNTLYPVQAYNTTFDRIETFIADLLIDCNEAAYHKGFGNKAFAYKFSVAAPGSPFPPGYHIQDLSYTFLDGTNPRVDSATALDMQTRFVNFVVHGDPNAGNKALAMPVYGNKHQMLEYTLGGGKQIISDTNAVGLNKRCAYWDSM